MINFFNKSDTIIGLPSGVGTRGGSNSQFTWQSFVAGVNQQDSGGNSIVSTFTAYQFVGAVGPLIGPVNPSINLNLLTLITPGVFIIQCSATPPGYNYTCVIDFTFSGGASDGITQASTNALGVNDLLNVVGGASVMHQTFSNVVPPATVINIVFNIGTVSVQPINTALITMSIP